MDLWGLETTEYQKAIIKVLAEHAVYDIDLQNYIKTNTTIEVVRSSLDNGNNGQYFKSTVSVKVGDIVLNESKIQSTADHPYLNDGKPEHEGRTIEPGEYTGTLLNKSHSYNKAISISENGESEKEWTSGDKVKVLIIDNTETKNK